MRSPSLSLMLGLLAGLFLGLPLLLVGGYVWQAGLDLRSPSSSREWIKLCARGHEDIFCKAARSVVAREVPGPFVLLYPGVTGDRDLTAALTVWKGHYPTSEELDALVRANLFAAAELRTGQIRSLDGQVQRVTCAADERGTCQIGPLKVSRYTQPRSANDGAIYIPFNPKRQESFLPPI